MSNLSKTTHDHEEIRKWAEERKGKPSHVKGTGGKNDPGLLRIDFPGYSGEGKLEEISWDEFFREFEERKLALLYDPKSLFSKIIGRDTVERREQGDHDAARGDSSAGQGDADRGAARSADRHSLEQREYRDADGKVHHHTNTYMDQHGSKR